MNSIRVCVLSRNSLRERFDFDEASPRDLSTNSKRAIFAFSSGSFPCENFPVRTLTFEELHRVKFFNQIHGQMVNI